MTLFTLSEWAQPATLVPGTTGEGAALLCSIGRRGIRQPVVEAQQVRALFKPLIALSAFTQPATVLAGTT
jgi:hypothetical protein